MTDQPTGRMADLTKNFTWAEMTRGSDADQLTDEIRGNIIDLAQLCLQPLRDLHGAPLRVNSGWRDPDHNAAIGGHPSSKHMLGLAGDIAPTTSLASLWSKLLASRIPFDRAALYPTFIHIELPMPGGVARRLVYQAPKGVWTQRTHAPYPQE